MRLPGASCPATQSASRLAKVPLEVRWPRILGPAEHGGDLADGLDLHLRAGPAAVAGVVVGIDGHGQRIGGARHRMRRLEHLPGIERMEVGVVVAPAGAPSPPEPGPCVGMRRQADSKAGRAAKLRFKQLSGAGQQAGNRIVRHGDLPQ